MLAGSIEWLILGRIVQAAGGAVGLVLARAIVRDVYPADEAAGIIATLVMVMVVMPMVSPLVGGEMLVRFDWHSIFYLVAAISLLLVTPWMPFVHGWLTAKILLLVGYIVAGMFAMKETRSLQVRVIASVLALVQITAIFYLAVTKPF
jgi:DHA1 family bicyclomycin/chloramphenicol resistance-like MFS transporter